MPDLDSKSIDPFVELANKGLHKNRGYDFLEFMPQLRGKQAAEVYREMAQNDALIGAILFAIEMVLRRVEWEVPPKGQDDYHLARADFLYSCMQDMSMPWEEVVSDGLTMLEQGFAWMEIVYKKRQSTDIDAPGEIRTKFPDGKVGWRKFVLVPPETIEDFVLDDFGGIQACIQGAGFGTDRVVIPIEKSVHFRTTSRSPRGKSILRNVVQSWYRRKRIQEFEGIGIERDLAGLPVMYVEHATLANATKMADYQNIVRNVRRDEQEGILLPAIKEEGRPLEPIARLDLLTSGGARQFNTNEIINRYGREIAVAVLQDLVILGHEKIGTQALASEKRDLSDTALQTWLNHEAAVLNTHAVPRLFALNGESLEELPELVPGELRPTDVIEFSQAVKAAADAGFIFDDPDAVNEVRRRLGFAPLSPEEMKLLDEVQNRPPESTGPPQESDDSEASDMGGD